MRLSLERRRAATIAFAPSAALIPDQVSQDASQSLAVKW